VGASISEENVRVGTCRNLRNPESVLINDAESRLMVSTLRGKKVFLGSVKCPPVVDVPVAGRAR
jgi:hypothetical protein